MEPSSALATYGFSAEFMDYVQHIPIKLKKGRPPGVLSWKARSFTSPM